MFNKSSNHMNKINKKSTLIYKIIFLSLIAVSVHNLPVLISRYFGIYTWNFVNIFWLSGQQSFVSQKICNVKYSKYKKPLHLYQIHIQLIYKKLLEAKLLTIKAKSFWKMQIPKNKKI